MINVLVVDDSEGMRKWLTRILEKDGAFRVVGAAGDPYEAREQLMKLKPDVMTLDIEMPRMNGLEFLEKLMAYQPMPVVMISTQTRGNNLATLRALQLGAMEVLCKPESPAYMEEFARKLGDKIRAVFLAKPRVHTLTPAAKLRWLRASSTFELLAIGASTGGIDAIQYVLSALPADMPPILITQHLPAAFTATFTKMLNNHSELTVKEACGGERLDSGLVLVAPGNRHMVVERDGGHFVAQLQDGPEVCFQRPSVEVLFKSIADLPAVKAVGVLLTGMGNDGAQGLLDMRCHGAYTIAQNEATSVIYGMPKVAAELGAAEDVLPLDEIPLGIIRGFRELRQRTGERDPRTKPSTRGGGE